MARQSDADRIASLQRQNTALQEALHRLNVIRILWVTAHNAPVSVEKSGVEFFYLAGEVLEGLQVEKLPFKYLSKEEVMLELTDA